MAGGNAVQADGAACPLLRLPIKLAGQVIRGRLTPWEKAQLALASKHTHAIACASVEALVLLDARFTGAGSGSFSARGSSSGGSSSGGSSSGGVARAAASDYRHPDFLVCASVSLRPRTMAMLSKMVSGLLLPNHLRQRLSHLEEIAIEIHDVFLAQCDLSLHVTSIALHMRGVKRLRIDQPGLFTMREAVAVVRMASLESLAIVCTQGLEPGALAVLATGCGSTSSDGGAPPAPTCSSGRGLRGKLRHLHVEIVSDDSPITCFAAPKGSGTPTIPVGASWVGAPLSPATPTGRQAAGPAPKLSADDETALQGFAITLEALALIGLEPQLRGCVTKPWEPLLAKAADMGPDGAPLKRLALRTCGPISAAALAAAADVASLEQVDLSGSVVAAGDVERLARVQGLTGLGMAPMHTNKALLMALAAGCPKLSRISTGGLAAPAVAAAEPAAAAASSVASVVALGSVLELQLIGCTGHGQQLLSRAGLGLCVTQFPNLRAIEVCGAWEVDEAGVAGLCELIAKMPRLKRVRVQGSAARPLHAPLLMPLMSSNPGLSALELLCVEGLDDEWMIEVVKRATKAGTRCTFREVADLALGGVPPPLPGHSGIPPPPLLAAPPQVAKTHSTASAGASSAAAGAAPAAAAVGQTAPGQLGDKGLVRLFGAMRLKRLVLQHMPNVTLSGIKALTRGAGELEKITCVGCPALVAAPRDAVVRAGVLGSRIVEVNVWE